MPLILISFYNNHFDCISPVDEKSILCENLSLLSEYYVITKTGSKFDQCMNSGGGVNTNFPTCAVDGADQ